jgi:predicted phosphoribosyltransferase
MVFKDREEAGRKLAAALKAYAGRPDVLVAALPRGGVVLGRVVADALKVPLDLVVPRKIGAPGHEEYAIGAIAESGEAVWNEAKRRNFDPRDLTAIVEREKVEARRRLGTYRQGLPPRDFRDKTVLLVDDGVATGYTMRAAIRSAREEGPKRIVAAVPVCPEDSLSILKKEADEAVVLHVPILFFAIGAFYGEFPQVSDEEVLRLMKR